MRLGPDRLGLLGAGAVLGLAFLSYGGGPAPEPPAGRVAIDAPAPRRPPAAAPPGPALAAVSPGDPGFAIELGRKRDSTGTAFAIGGGAWMTARHVVDGCRRVGILTGARRAARVRGITLHPNADLAVFQAGVSADRLGFGERTLTAGQTGFHFGFPRGRPGQVQSRLLGRMTMRISGRYRTREPVIAWAEQIRIPDINEPLSGISGGPVLDRDGRVVGVHVAGSKRRGRSFTTAPVSIRQMLDRAGLAPSPAGSRAAAMPVATDNFARLGERLRGGRTVAQVICQVS